MINGRTLRDAIISAANNISNQRKLVDELNVFPVPDGDTGTNMYMTISAGKKELAKLPDHCTVDQVAQTAASALLRGARGNSGVILSLLFRGFAKGLAGKNTAGAADFTEALAIGVKAAYKAVMKPTEGTMLTVARVSSEQALAEGASITDPVEWWRFVCKQAEITLDQTPEMLPVLKKAGVVDSGGKGLVVIFEGMLHVFEGKGVIALKDGEEKTSGGNDLSDESFRNAAAQFDGEITFTYCTEFIVKRENDNDPLKLRAYLESIGDSVVVVDDDDIIKVHVHTDDPGSALHKAIAYGALTSVKIENMREQHETLAQTTKAQAEKPQYVPVDPDVPYGFVAVAAGDGVIQLFKDLGADQVVSGGQTMNPSTDDILEAIEAIPAKTVFVLPNNKNIIMAAEQTVKLADREVCVLPTRSIPQGLSAMLSFDPDVKTLDNQLAMTRAFERVGTGQITFAARDSEYDGHTIKEGELLAIENGKLSFVERDLQKACVKLIRSLVKKDTSFITLMYGEDVEEEQAERVVEALKAKLDPDIEITLVNGGQPVYYFIASVE